MLGKPDLEPALILAYLMPDPTVCSIRGDYQLLIVAAFEGVRGIQG